MRGPSGLELGAKVEAASLTASCARFILMMAL